MVNEKFNFQELNNIKTGEDTTDGDEEEYLYRQSEQNFEELSNIQEDQNDLVHEVYRLPQDTPHSLNKVGMFSNDPAE